MLSRTRSLTPLIAAGAGSYSAFKATQKVAYSAAADTATVAPITLYQYKICPFCNRVKAYLDFLDVEYKSVEVNPLTKSQISFSKDHKKVPLVTFGESNPMGESGEIIEYITKNVADSGKLNKSKFFSEDSDKWTEWSEKKLAVFLYPNITRSYEESWECFEYSADVPEWNLPERLVTRPVGSFFMSLANGKIKKKYNIVDERKELKECISEWTDAVGDKKFLHGEFVTMPDIMVYGVLRAIAGFTTFRELMAEDVKLKTWYDNVQAAVTK